MSSSPVDGKRPALRVVKGGRVPAAPAESAQPAPNAAWDDSELLAALRAGDRSVATAFYDRVRPPLERTIRRLLGHGDPDHEDVAQIALMQLVTTIDRYRGDCSLDTWVSTLTARVIYKSIRRRRLERGLFDASQFVDALAVERVASEPAPGGRRAIVQRVTGHLNDMDPARAWVFTLHDVWGYDLREIAQIMNVSVAAAQSRLVRARREVHTRVADDSALLLALREIGVVP